MSGRLDRLPKDAISVKRCLKSINGNVQDCVLDTKIRLFGSQ